MLLDITTHGWKVIALDNVVDQTITWTVLIGVFLATSFISLKFAWEYWRYSVGSMQGNSALYVWDWNEIIRVMFIVMLIGVYKPVATGFTETIGYINSLTEPNSANHKKLEATANKWYVNTETARLKDDIKMLKERKNAYRKSGDSKKERIADKQLDRLREELDGVPYSQNGTPEGGDDMRDVGKNVAENIGSFGFSIEMAVAGLTTLIAMCIKWSVGTFFSVLFKLGLCFGPIVLAFGIFFREKPISYFNQLLNVGLTFTTINILDMIFFKYILSSYNEPSAKGAIAFNMALIGCYWSVGKITKWYVGETGFSSIMQRGLGTATSVVVGALTAAGMIASGGASAGAGGAAASGGSSAGANVSRGANAVGGAISRSGNKRVD